MVPHMFTVAFATPGIEVQFPNVKKKEKFPSSCYIYLHSFNTKILSAR